MEEDSAQDGIPRVRQSQSEKNQLRGTGTKQGPFYKSQTVSFVRVGNCHMCKMRNKMVYQCFRNYQATSCEKKFCLDCLVLIYKENIIQYLQKNESWRCPYLRKVCRCKNCCSLRKETYSVLQLDANQSVYANLRSKPGKYDEEDEPEFDESLQCLMKEKFKKVIDFNGQLINKVNTNYHKLTEDEIKFYNKLIHSNLKVLNNTARNMIANHTLIED